jgi:hypothetical protein
MQRRRCFEARLTLLEHFVASSMGLLDTRVTGRWTFCTGLASGRIKHAAQGLLDHVFDCRHDGRRRFAIVVGIGCHHSHWLRMLVGGLPQRLVLKVKAQLLGF